eukprot:5414630-Prymnesium_polylepis.1
MAPVNFHANAYELTQQAVGADGLTAWQRNQAENKAKSTAAKTAIETARAEKLAKATEMRAKIAAEKESKS